MSRTINVLRLNGNISQCIVDLRRVDSIKRLELGTNNFPYLHIQGIVINTEEDTNNIPELVLLTDVSSITYPIFVPDDVFENLIQVTTWMDLYDETNYQEYKTAFDASVTANGGSKLYDLSSDSLTMTNKIFPESIMYWMGFGKCSYELENGESKYIQEPEDRLDDTTEIEDVLEVGDIDKVVLLRKEVPVYESYVDEETGETVNPTDELLAEVASVENDNEVLDYIYFNIKNDNYLNKMYGWLFKDITALTASQSSTFSTTDASGNTIEVDKTKITDLTCLKYCTNLTKIVNYAAYQFTNLKKVWIPKSITTINGDPWNSTGNISEVYIDDFDSYVGNIGYSSGLDPVLGRNTNANIYVVTNGVPKLLTGDLTITKLKGMALLNYKQPMTITLSPSINLTSIPGSAFLNCTGLTKVTLPSKITSINTYAFSGCTNLKEINLDNITTLSSYAIQGIGIEGDFVMPSKLSSIGSSNFSAWANMTSFTSNAIVTGSSYGMIGSCKKLKKVKLHPGVWTSCSAAMCNSCTALESFTVPPLTTIFANQCLSGCTSLKYIIVHPLSTTLELPKGNTRQVIPNGTFPIYVPSGTIDSFYKTDTNWSGYSSQMKETGGEDWVTLMKSLAETAGMSDELDDMDYSNPMCDLIIDGWGRDLGTAIITKDINFTSRMYNNATSSVMIDDTTNVIDKTYVKKSYLSGITSMSVLRDDGTTNTSSSDTVLVDATDLQYTSCTGFTSFRSCTALKRVIYPDTATGAFTNQGFAWDTALEEVTFPAGITSIAELDFYNDSNMKKIRFKGTTPPTINSTSNIANNMGTPKYFVPASALSTYKEQWSGFADRIFADTEWDNY